MKPIIISVTEDENGYIRMKKSDFEKCITDAYECGKSDGSARPQSVNYPWNQINTRELAKEIGNNNQAILC